MQAHWESIWEHLYGTSNSWNVIRWKFFPRYWPFVRGIHHYSDAIMDPIASQITSLTIVYSSVYSGADQRKHLSSASLASNAGNVSIWWRHHDNKGYLMFSLSYAWTNVWANHRHAGDLRRHRAYYDVTVMWRVLRSIVLTYLSRNIYSLASSNRWIKIVSACVISLQQHTMTNNLAITVKLIIPCSLMKSGAATIVKT